MRDERTVCLDYGKLNKDFFTEVAKEPIKKRKNVAKGKIFQGGQSERPDQTHESGVSVIV